MSLYDCIVISRGRWMPSIGAHGEEGPADGLWGRALLSSMPENLCLTIQLYLTCC